MIRATTTTAAVDYFSLASAAWNGGDKAQAFELFKQGADAGDASCANNFGVFLETGAAGSIDYVQAEKYYLLAYALGDVAAASNLAGLYITLTKYDEARTWYDHAVEAGDGDAMVEYAELLVAGEVWGEDRIVALDLARRATASGSITPEGNERALSLLVVLGA